MGARTRAARQHEAAEAASSDRQPEGHSGRLLVRMPQTLHADLAAAAEREQVSLNQFITGVLAAAVGWRQPGENGAAPPEHAPLERPSDTGSPRRSNRTLALALIVNAVLVAIAAVVAIALLIAAWT
jgi:hypothetical protein